MALPSLARWAPVVSRAGRRSLGKRRLRREAHRDVTRIISLSEEGYSPSVIASSEGLDEGFVRVVLKQAEAVRSEAGEGASVGRQM